VSDVLKCIYDTLNANGIEIPFPQRDIHIRSMAPAQQADDKKNSKKQNYE